MTATRGGTAPESGEASTAHLRWILALIATVVLAARCSAPDTSRAKDAAGDAAGAGRNDGGGAGGADGGGGPRGGGGGGGGAAARPDSGGQGGYGGGSGYTCDLAAQNCPPDEMCVPICAAVSVPTCVSDPGSGGTHGVPCTPGDPAKGCAKGHNCTGRTMGDPLCLKFCATSSDCPKGKTCLIASGTCSGTPFMYKVCAP